MENVLGSTVIAAIISGVVSYLVLIRKSKLKYITEERQKWREDIREIAENIEKNTYSIKNDLTKLKVRINAYGRNNKNDDSCYYNDAHIFKIIKEIEKYDKERNYEKISEKKEILIEYLSFLLKYDWERAKAEVKEGIFNLGSAVLFVLGLVTSISILVFNTNFNLSKIILIVLYLFLLINVDKCFYDRYYCLKSIVHDVLEKLKKCLFKRLGFFLKILKCSLIIVVFMLTINCTHYIFNTVIDEDIKTSELNCNDELIINKENRIVKVFKSTKKLKKTNDTSLLSYTNVIDNVNINMKLVHRICNYTAIICLSFSSLIKIKVNFDKYKRDKKYADNLWEYDKSNKQSNVKKMKIDKQKCFELYRKYYKKFKLL